MGFGLSLVVMNECAIGRKGKSRGEIGERKELEGKRQKRKTYPDATNSEAPNDSFPDAKAQYAPASTMKPICKLRKTITNMMFVRSEQIR